MHEAAKRRHIHSLGREPLKKARLPFSQAAKRRQIHSLGREPQEEKRSIQSSPERATDLHVCLSPLRGWFYSVSRFLGLTPQAKYLSRLRR
jgi:hypothetical protein